MSMYYNYANPNNVAGQTFNGVQPQNIKFTQPLTKDQAAELTKSDSMFSLKVTNQDINRAICTHKFPNTNKFSINACNDGTGDVVCTICGARFNPDDLTHEKVEQIIKDFKNVMECCKLMYVNIPENVVKQLFTILPFVDKIPKLYDISVENYSRFAPNASSTQDVYGQSSGLFNSFREIIGGGNMGYPVYGAPQGYPQPQYPNYATPTYPTYGAPQQMNQPAYGTYQDPNANPFFAGGTTPTPQPVAPAPVPTPVPVPGQVQQPQYPVYGAPQPQAAPVASTPDQPAVNGAVERVNATGTLEA